MSENKESNNTGCLIFIIIQVIGNIIYYFMTKSEESIAETGEVILTIVGLVIAYFICKAMFGNNSKDSDNSSNTSHPIANTTKSTTNSDHENNSSQSSWVRILTGIACLIITGLIVGYLTSSFNFKYGVGALVTVVSIIALGYFLYNSFKE